MKNFEEFLNEIFNESVDVKLDSEDFPNLYGYFNINNFKYQIKLEYFNITLRINENYKIYGLKFYVFDDIKNSYSLDLLNNSNNAFKVFGTLGVVLNKAIDKINPDILFYNASDKKGISLYSKLTNLAVEKHNLGFNEFDSYGSKFFILTNGKTELEPIINMLKSSCYVQSWT